MAEQSSLTVAADTQVERSTQVESGLLRATVAAPFRAEAISLPRNATSAQALVVIATSCLRQIALNERGVRDGSTEAVHQMRVGVRRLRAALSTFGSVFRPGEFDALKHELVWLTGQLGAAREYDVLSESRRKFSDLVSPGVGTETELDNELDRRRQEAFAMASRAVQSVRFERLIVSSAVRLISRAPAAGTGDQFARDLACDVLERRTRRVLRRLARFERLGVRERHQLRIVVKKLRYGTEFFASLFPDATRPRKRFSRQLEALQEVLGSLNDMTVNQRIAGQLIDDGGPEPRTGPRVAFAMGALIGFEQAEQRSLLAAMPKLRSRLAKAPRFWR